MVKNFKFTYTFFFLFSYYSELGSGRLTIAELMNFLEDGFFYLNDSLLQTTCHKRPLAAFSLINTFAINLLKLQQYAVIKKIEVYSSAVFFSNLN